MVQNLYENILLQCKQHGERNFLVLPKNRKISYYDFSQKLIEVNNWLLDENHFGHFSIIAPNSLNYLLYLFASLKNGGTAVNLNPNLTSTEIKERLNLGEVSVLITTDSIYNKLQSILSETCIQKVFIIDEFAYEFEEPKVINLQSNLKYKNNSKRDVAFLQFTGGTTGTNKAAVTTHTQVLANIEQLNKHFGAYIDLKDLHVLIAFPFYHIFSIVFNVLFFMSNGGTCYLYQDLRDTSLILKLLKENPINFTVAVNTWYKKLMQHAAFKSLDTSKIKTSLAGGEYVPLSTKNQWQAFTGKPLYSAYGLTETASLSIVSPLDKINIDDSIGIPIPQTEVTLLDENENEIKANNLAGELALKGPQVTLSYYKNQEETAKAFSKGWFKTGDIAERINGKFYKIVDRKKDMISVSGNKVYPNEVEAIISKLEDILDVGVVARKSEKSGEEVVACVVLKEKSALSNEKIIGFCRKYLSRYKIPKEIYKFKELPKTPIGKTFRKGLREIVQLKQANHD